MIKINELKIGNAVKYNNGLLGYVYSIHSPMPIKDSVFSDKPYVTLFTNGLTDVLVEDLEPIFLTKEMLYPMFPVTYRTDKSDVFILENFMITYVLNGRFKGKRYLKYANITFEDFGEFKALHQFQNLYYNMTGKELVLPSLASFGLGSLKN